MSRRLLLLSFLLLPAPINAVGPPPRYSPEFRQALAKAGANRAELLRALY